MNKQQHQLMAILQKIRVFSGMSLTDAERLLGICTSKRYKAGEHVYLAGDLSDTMLVLIAGSLSVRNAAGETLGTVQPGQSTGEMGVFTGHRRSATVTVEKDSAGLLIKKDLLRGLMAQDREMAIRILENVVGLLSERLAESNKKVHEAPGSAAGAAGPSASEAGTTPVAGGQPTSA